MSWLEYFFTHCIPRSIQNFGFSFNRWIHLLQGDYEEYRIYNGRKYKYTEQELFEMLRTDFWYSLEGDILEKEFLEYLISLSKDVQDGLVETELWTEEDFDELMELVGEE